MKSDAFTVYMTQVLAPTLVPGDVVVLDNPSSHKAAQIEAAIEARGAQLLFLPPYSPDFDPIEHCWSKIKTWLRMATRHARLKPCWKQLPMPWLRTPLKIPWLGSLIVVMPSTNQKNALTSSRAR